MADGVGKIIGMCGQNGKMGVNPFTAILTEDCHIGMERVFI